MPGGATHRVGVPPDLDAVRASYDRVADRYVAMGLGELDAHPWLRAVLAAFAEEVGTGSPTGSPRCSPRPVWSRGRAEAARGCVRADPGGARRPSPG